MRKQQTTLKKRITFEEWKARKDTESKRAKETFIEQKIGSASNLTRERGVNSTGSVNIALKQIANLRTGHEGKCQRKPSSSLVETDVLREDSLIVKESGSLTFNEWLHNKNVIKQCEMRRKILEKEEKERKKRERDENGKKAYNTWLIQNKHRTLEKYYPQLGKEKIKAILLEDISKLGLTSSKDVGVGELSAGQQLSVGSNSSLNQRKQQKN